MEKKTLKTILKTPQNSSLLSSKNPRTFISKKGNQGIGTESCVKSRCAAAPNYCRNAAMPCFHGNPRAACAAPPGARCPLVPLSVVLHEIQIWALGFDETTLQGQWLFLQAFNHQLMGFFGFFFISCHGPRNIQDKSY